MKVRGQPGGVVLSLCGYMSSGGHQGCMVLYLLSHLTSPDVLLLTMATDWHFMNTSYGT